jgi:hypothetical protein
LKSRLDSLGICSLSHFQALNGLFIQPLGVHARAGEGIAGSHLDCAGGGWGFGGLVICLSWAGDPEQQQEHRQVASAVRQVA